MIISYVLYVYHLSMLRSSDRKTDAKEGFLRLVSGPLLLPSSSSLNFEVESRIDPLLTLRLEGEAAPSSFGLSFIEALRRNDIVLLRDLSSFQPRM